MPGGRETRRSVLELHEEVLAPPGRAQGDERRLDPPHLDEMPAAQRVLDAMRGEDERETALRQTAAFHQLRKMIQKLAGGREFKNELTPDEQRLLGEYATAGAAIANPLESALSGRAREDWFGQRSVLETSDDFRDELLERFFTEQWGLWYLETTIGADQALRRLSDRRYGKGMASTTFQLLPSVRRRLQLELAAAVALALLAVWRETRPFGADPAQSDGVRAGFRRYRIHTATGTLGSVRKTEYVTRKSTYDVNGRWNGIHETTQILMEFKLYCSDAGGQILAAEVDGTSAPLHEGHPASLAWLIRRGRSTGSFFLLLNHQTGSRHTWNETLQKAFRPLFWWVLPFTWIAYTLPRFTSQAETWPLLPGSLGLLTFIAYFVWRRRTMLRRIDAFQVATERPLMASLRARALELFPEKTLAPERPDLV